MMSTLINASKHEVHEGFLASGVTWEVVTAKDAKLAKDLLVRLRDPGGIQTRAH